jgi:hypothetical protein
MACRNPSASSEFERLDESSPGAERAPSAEQAPISREELKSLFRELVGLVDSLRAAEGAHELESDVAVRVREARQALEKSLASHGLLGIPATAVSPGHTRRESIKTTKRFIASSGASLKATLMFGKR